MPKRAPGDPQSPSSINDLLQEAEDRLRAEIAQAKQFIEANEEQIQRIEGIRGSSGAGQSQRPSTGPFRYANMQTIDALCLYLERTQKAQPREHMIDEVLSGGVYAGRGEGAKGEPRVQVNKSINYWLMPADEKSSVEEKAGIPKKLRRIKVQPRLRAVGDLIGLAEWPEEKFTA